MIYKDTYGLQHSVNMTNSRIHIPITNYMCREIIFSHEVWSQIVETTPVDSIFPDEFNSDRIEFMLFL